MRIEEFIAGDVVDRLAGVLVLVAADGAVLDANTPALECYGYSRGEILALHVDDLRVPAEQGAGVDTWREVAAGRLTHEDLHRHKDGTTFAVELKVASVSAEGRSGLLASVRDISDRRGEQDARRESEERFKAVFEGATDGIWLLTTRGAVAAVNSAMAEMHGYTIDEMLAMKIWELDTPESALQAPVRLQRILDGERLSFESEHVCKDGSIRPFDVSASLVEIGGQQFVLGFDRDITERRSDEEILRTSEHRYRTLLNSASDAVYVHSMNEEGRPGRFLEVNEAACVMLGYTRDEFLSMGVEEIDTPEQIARDHSGILDRLRAGDSLTIETEHVAKDGRRIPVEISVSMLDLHGESTVLSVVRDVSERRMVQEAIAESERWLTESQRIASLGHYVYDIVNDTWEASPSLQAVFGMEGRAGSDFSGWLDIVHPNDRAELARYFTEEVLGKHRPFDIEYRIVRRSDGAARWVHGLGTVEYGDDDEPLAMFGVIQDITERRQVEAELERRGERLEELLSEREHNLERLGKALASIVEVVSQVVETRDPYTAGHQRRVSELAATISQEMGLPEDQVEEIRIAALIHDVGKMSVPAEVLSKPGVLTALEFELIKEHAEAGYRIIASADMEGPTAEIVYQHQERCDGSGYPRGLTGPELLEGAKVIMVADVVEAMSSHRPYRSALGIDAALEEIEAGAGTRYDPAVAESCLRAFRERGFAFSE